MEAEGKIKKDVKTLFQARKVWKKQHSKSLYIGSNTVLYFSHKTSDVISIVIFSSVDFPYFSVT